MSPPINTRGTGAALGRVLINRRPNADLDVPPNVCPLMTQGDIRSFTRVQIICWLINGEFPPLSDKRVQ